LSWIRSHSVRVRLTLWYVAAMSVVLGVYVFAVYSFVDRSIADTVDEQLRDDIYWVTASVYQTPDGSLMLNEPEQLAPEADAPWVQVWNADGSELLYRNSEAIRRSVPQSQSISTEGIATIRTETVAMRILTQRHDFLARRDTNLARSMRGRATTTRLQIRRRRRATYAAELDLHRSQTCRRSSRASRSPAAPKRR
jgi:hypothetical protein